MENTEKIEYLFTGKYIRENNERNYFPVVIAIEGSEYNDKEAIKRFEDTCPGSTWVNYRVYNFKNR